MSFAATEPTSVSSTRDRVRSREPADAGQEILMRGLIFFAVAFGVLGVVAFGAQ